MKKYIIITILVSVVGINFAGIECAYAEENTPRFSRSLRSLEGLKKRVVVLMKENNQLEAEYALLQREYQTLNKRYEKHTGKLKQLKHERKGEARVINKHRKRLYDLQEGVPDVEANKLILDSRVAYINRQLIDMDETLQMLKLKISSLEFESRDIEMAQKVRDYKRNDLENQQSLQVQELKNIYEKNVEKEKELLVEIERMEEEGKNTQFEINQLKTGNKEVSLHMDQTKVRLAMQRDENELLRKKKLYEVRVSENKIWQYDQKNLALENLVGQLEQKVNKLGEKIEVSQVKQTQKRGILDAIMRIDHENQNLKDKISELQKKMEDIK